MAIARTVFADDASVLSTRQPALVQDATKFTIFFHVLSISPMTEIEARFLLRSYVNIGSSCPLAAIASCTKADKAFARFLLDRLTSAARL